MRSLPALRHLFLIAVVGLTFGLLLLFHSLMSSAAAPPNLRGPVAQWGGGPGRNLVNLTDKGLPLTWSTKIGQQKNIKWSADLGSHGFTSPVVAGGKVYVGTNNEQPRNKAVEGDKGVLMCFRASDGKFLWQALHDKHPEGRSVDWPQIGVSSTPAVEGDRVYYVNNLAEVVCVSTGGLAAGNRGVKDEKYRSKIDADIVWRLDLMDLGVYPHNYSKSSPLLVGDLLYVVTGNGVDQGHVNLPAPNAPSFLAIDKKTGRVAWKSNAPGRNVLHGQWSSPVYASVAGRGQVVFPGGDGWLYGFEPKTGRLLWKFDCNPKGAVRQLGAGGTRNHFLATPVVWEGKLYIGVGEDPEHGKGVGHLWCIDLAKALAKGSTNPNKDVSPFSGPKDENPKFDPKDARNANSALVWHYGGFNPAGAARPYAFGRTLSTCAVHDGLCYAADYDGYLYCLDAKTGAKQWEHKMVRADTWSSPYWVDGKVYLGNEKGEIYAFQHGRRLVKPTVVRMGNVSTKVRATPVAAGGVLYVVTENPCKLWAIAAR